MTYSQSVPEPAAADFSAYGPGNGAAAFMAEPVYDAVGTVEGVVAFRYPPKMLEAVVGDRAGLGVTGEVLIVGSDRLLRVDSSLNEGDDVLSTKLDNEVVDSALAGAQLASAPPANGSGWPL